MDLLDEDYQEQADLVTHALVGVGSVFELQVRETTYSLQLMGLRIRCVESDTKE